MFSVTENSYRCEIRRSIMMVKYNVWCWRSILGLIEPTGATWLTGYHSRSNGEMYCDSTLGRLVNAKWRQKAITQIKLVALQRFATLWYSWWRFSTPLYGDVEDKRQVNSTAGIWFNERRVLGEVKWSWCDNQLTRCRKCRWRVEQAAAEWKNKRRGGGKSPPEPQLKHNHRRLWM